MKIFLCSDLHLDTYKDPYTIIDLICSKAPLVNVLVLAGDTAEGRNSIWLEAMRIFADHFNQVVFTLSNHFYYGSGSEIESVAYKADSWSNTHLLNCNTININGISFGGGAMWFRPDPLNNFYRRALSDFSQIKNFDPWVYEENAKFLKWLYNLTDAPDVMVTHHVPSNKCINSRFLKSIINRFFVCDIEDWIVDKQPMLFFNGHSHYSHDFMIDNTRLVSNPYGYPAERLVRSFNENLIVEV